jgi:hypothetical protein
MPSRRPIVALLLLCAALAAGCGGDAEGENAYVEDVQAAQRTFVTRFDQVRRRLAATSTLAQDRATLASFAQITGSFDASLARIEPPAGVRKQHRALVAVIARLEQQFERGRLRLRRGSDTDRSVVRTELSSSVDDTQAQVSEAVADINAGLRG